jgi:hypothetical protein
VVPRDERWCPNCLSRRGLKNIEDEIHFLCSCNLYSNLRELYLSNEKLGLKNHLSQDKLFLYLLTTEGLSVNLVAKFCSKAFQI